MAKKAEIKVKITGDKSNLDKVLRGAQAGIKSFGSAAVTGLKVVTASAATAAVALAYGTKEAYDLGGALVDLSAATGMTADQVLILQQAGKDAGIEDFTAAVGKMQKALVDSIQSGTGPAAKALGLLGLKGEELIKKTPVDQIKEIGEAIRGIKNPAIRTSVLRDLFGKSGPKLNSFFENPEALTEAAESIGKQAKILRDNAAAFDAVSDRLNRSGLKLQGFFVGFAKGVLPVMDQITKQFDKIDLADQGEKFAAAILAAAHEIQEIYKNFQGIKTVAKALANEKGQQIAQYAAIANAVSMGASAKAGSFGQGMGAGLKAVVASQFPLLSGMAKSMDGWVSSVKNAVEVGKAANAVLMPEVVVEANGNKPKAAPWKGMNRTLTTGSIQGASMAGSATDFNSKFGERFGPQAPAMMSGMGQGALARGAYGQTPLLSIGERRRSENFRVANGGNPDVRASTSNAYRVVRSGDKKRMEGVERQKLRDEEGLKGVNTKLTKIEEYTAATAGALTEDAP